MKAAAQLAGRVTKLVLLESNPFHLLAQNGHVDAFAEAIELRNCIFCRCPKSGVIISERKKECLIVKVAHIRLCHSRMLYVRFGVGFLLLA